jgi:hypothetical protein
MTFAATKKYGRSRGNKPAPPLQNLYEKPPKEPKPTGFGTHLSDKEIFNAQSLFLLSIFIKYNEA